MNQNQSNIPNRQERQNRPDLMRAEFSQKKSPGNTKPQINTDERRFKQTCRRMALFQNPVILTSITYAYFTDYTDAILNS